MRNQKPPFEITNAMYNEVAEISNLVGQVTVFSSLSTNPTLRRTNRIKTIHGSLAIEQNTLSIEQVTAVLNGKRVLAPPKDIAEVLNANNIYEQLSDLDPYSIDDLLKAHRIMTQGLVRESGTFRSGNVGVVDRNGKILHLGALPQFVPDLVTELIEWVQSSDLHMILRSCVFHYEFELIHPFADGNGRVGRLWHTLLLSKWSPTFAWLPIESIIHDNQEEYYAAINASNMRGESTIFIEFMLSIIKETLLETIYEIDERNNKADSRWKKIQAYLKSHEYIMNGDIRSLCDVSSATANRILANLVKEDKLIKVRKESFWAYRKK